MRLLDDAPMDPDLAAELHAIDATLAGEPVDPQYAELAELALLLADDRPTADPVFAHTLDERVAGRFHQPVRKGPGWYVQQARSRSWSTWLAGGAAATALAAAVVTVVVFTSNIHGAGSTSASSSSASAGSSAVASPAVGAAGRNSSGAAKLSPSEASGGATSSSSSAQAPLNSAPSPGRAPQPPSNGRKTIQSAQLNLSAAPNRVDDVAQEAFDVVGQQNGIVNRSSVTQTGGSDGYAFMQLSVPSSSLAQTMTKLSQLTYARVSSRTDNSQDVNNRYRQTKRGLADAQALHTALLKQLANATTTQQVDSLKAQIHDAEQSNSRDEAALAGLNHRIAFSAISLTINAGPQPPAPAGHHSGGFTLGNAAHDAGRVLVVLAGVALIALAVLVPVGVLAGIAWWVGGMMTHRRRERALDLA
jgi:hypothetical protein